MSGNSNITGKTKRITFRGDAKLQQQSSGGAGAALVIEALGR